MNVNTANIWQHINGNTNSAFKQFKNIHILAQNQIYQLRYYVLRITLKILQ